MQWMSYSVPAEALQIHPHRDHNYEIRPSDRTSWWWGPIFYRTWSHGTSPAPCGISSKTLHHRDEIWFHGLKLPIKISKGPSHTEIVAQTCNGHHKDVLVWNVQFRLILLELLHIQLCQVIDSEGMLESSHSCYCTANKNTYCGWHRGTQS